MKEIIFIYAKGCHDCNDMKDIIYDLWELWKKRDCDGDLAIFEYDSEQKEAVDVAIENNINDIPGCSFDNKVFCGKDFSRINLRKAISLYLGI